jgi:hypothetical protein
MGMLVVPTLNLSQNRAVPGTKYPSRTPKAMARKIHRVRYRSRNERRFMIPGFNSLLMQNLLIKCRGFTL